MENSTEQKTRVISQVAGLRHEGPATEGLPKRPPAPYFMFLVGVSPPGIIFVILYITCGLRAPLLLSFAPLPAPGATIVLSFTSQCRLGGTTFDIFALV